MFDANGAGAADGLTDLDLQLAQTTNGALYTQSVAGIGADHLARLDLLAERLWSPTRLENEVV